MKSLVQFLYNWYRQSLRNSKYRWVVILGTLVYLINPFDIAPDFLPIIGSIDDGILVTLLATELSQMFIQYRKEGKISKDVEQTIASPF